MDNLNLQYFLQNLTSEDALWNSKLGIHSTTYEKAFR
jgi:hypothetical protein